MPNFENHPLHPGDSLPFFISAGVIKEIGQLRPFLRIQDAQAAPVITLGSYTWNEFPGLAKAGEQDFVYYPETRMAGNARGLPNPGREGIAALKEPIRNLAGMGIKTVISVTNLPSESPLEVIPKLVEFAAESQPTAIEINFSCPNGKKSDGTFHPPLCNDSDASGEVIAEAREKVGNSVTLGAKDSPHVTSPTEDINREQITDFALSVLGSIDFVTGINTIGNQEFPELKCGNGRGGMSGPVIAPAARQHLTLWRELAPDLAYLSCGGVSTENAKDEVPARLNLGAILVGGAQEFYRARNPLDVVAQWGIEIS